MDDSHETRSPLKAKALRNPGQWCEERRKQIFEQKLETPLLLFVGMVALTVAEFTRLYLKAPPQPFLYLAMTFGFLAFALVRMRKYLPEMRNLALAAEGEKAVGQFLERLRAEGYEILHDVPANGFNVDHAIVGPAGIFTIETKTWRKPRSGNARISFDGETLLVNGKRPHRDPIVQARAQASWLANEVEAGTGRRFAVRPVVLFPGWWIDSAEGAHRDVWVLEPKALPKFLENEGSTMEPEAVRLVAYHLSRYIRTFAPGV
ncbi:MAG TPA: nuclease-related domain-containing protein [Usitatibacter sp.]|jgi:hypothetical protein|nr:nuclease-related domain-containing protein [Usitatibacter sp.]